MTAHEGGTAVHPQPPVLLFANGKGGVGKSHLAAHATAALSARGRRVLAIDGDPRGTLTRWLGIDQPRYGLNEILRTHEDDPHDAAGALRELRVEPGEEWRDQGPVHLLPGTRALQNRQADLTPGITLRLRSALQGVANEYDTVVIDTPGALGGVLLQALIAAATVAVIPTRLDAGGAEGVTATLHTLKLMREAAPDLRLGGIVVSAHTRRGSRDRRYHLTQLQEAHGELLLPESTWIPERTVCAAAQTAQAPITRWPEAATVVQATDALLTHLLPDRRTS